MKTRILVSASLTILALLPGLTAAPAGAASYMDPADGKWACSSPAGVDMGSIEITGLTYTFTKPDGTAAAPGDLRRVEFHDAPNFVVLSGYLKDDLQIAVVLVREIAFGGQFPMFLVDMKGNENSCLRTHG